MTRTAASLGAAVLAASLWLLWNYEHEHTRIRAPWTGATYVACGLCFVAAGYLGRGWRALLFAAVAAAAAVLLVDPLVWPDEPPVGPDDAVGSESCDPGCITREFEVVLAATAAATLAAAGMLVRRGLGRVRRRG